MDSRLLSIQRISIYSLSKSSLRRYSKRQASAWDSVAVNIRIDQWPWRDVRDYRAGLCPGRKAEMGLHLD